MRTLSRVSVGVLVLAGVASGCAGVTKQPASCLTPAAVGAEPPAAAADDEGPEFLFEWKVAGKRGAADALTDDPTPDEDDWIQADRPDFTETSNTIGKGRVQVEGGYTFTRRRADGATTDTHSYPELHVRLGMFADWFEWRIDQNFTSVGASAAPGGVAPAAAGASPKSGSGATDLLIGAKFALAEQKRALPEMAIIFQIAVPDGSPGFTGGKVLPGISYQYGWSLSERYTLAGSFVGNEAMDDDDHSFVQLASSVSLGANWTKRFGSYVEYIGFYPVAATSAGFTPQYYLDGGFSYKLTRNFQLDVRAGVGLNRAANDFFAGSGFAARF